MSQHRAESPRAGPVRVARRPRREYRPRPWHAGRPWSSCCWASCLPCPPWLMRALRTRRGSAPGPFRRVRSSLSLPELLLSTSRNAVLARAAMGRDAHTSQRETRSEPSSVRRRYALGERPEEEGRMRLRNPCEIRAGTEQAVGSELEVWLHNSGPQSGGMPCYGSTRSRSRCF